MKLKFILGLAFTVMLSLAVSSCESSLKRQIEKDAEIIITKIEAFQKENGSLPETLMEIGKKPEELEGPIIYIKMSPTRYELQALLSMDSSYHYDSDTKKWTRKP
jgi:hypothetical protein